MNGRMWEWEAYPHGGIMTPDWVEEGEVLILVSDGRRYVQALAMAGWSEWDDYLSAFIKEMSWEMMTG